MKLVVTLTLLAALTLPLATGAEEGLPSPPSGIPEILRNPLGVIERVMGININLSETFTKLQRDLSEPSRVIPGLLELWERVKAWFQANVGVNLGELVRGIANFLVWVFELLARLIRGILGFL